MISLIFSTTANEEMKIYKSDKKIYNIFHSNEEKQSLW
jgi:hypothetical protein